MSWATWRSLSRFQFRVGRGTIFETTASSSGRSLIKVTTKRHTGTDLQTAGGNETGPVAFCVDIGECCHSNQSSLILAVWFPKRLQTDFSKASIRIPSEVRETSYACWKVCNKTGLHLNSIDIYASDICTTE